MRAIAAIVLLVAAGLTAFALMSFASDLGLSLQAIRASSVKAATVIFGLLVISWSSDFPRPLK
jgi:hypothetical protein